MGKRGTERRRDCQPCRHRHSAALFGGQQLEIDCGRHCLIACLVRVQVIALVECSLDMARLVWIDHDLVKIDDAVELAAAADEFVDSEADLFLFGGVISSRRENRRKRRQTASTSRR